LLIFILGSSTSLILYQEGSVKSWGINV